MSGVETAHASLVAVANAQHCRSSVLTPSKVSMHTLPETASFSNIEALANTAKAASDAVYVATQGRDLVFSARLALAPKNDSSNAKGDADEDEGAHRPKKRRRDTSAEEADRVACARSRLAKSAPRSCPAASSTLRSDPHQACAQPARPEWRDRGAIVRAALQKAGAR